MFEHMYNSLLREKANEKNGHLTSQMSIYSRILLLGHSVVGAIRADCATDPHLGWDRSRAGTFPKRTPFSTWPRRSREKDSVSEIESDSGGFLRSAWLAHLRRFRK